MIRVLDEVAPLADERVIDPPAVDADALQPRAAKVFERAPHLPPELEDVPLQGTVLTDRLVRKAVDLADTEDATVQRAEHRPAAFGAEIERKKVGRHNLTAA